MPFDAPGNQKNGAVILIVQQGKVDYIWKPIEDGDPDSTPTIECGDSAGNRDDISDEPGESQILYPGDWITQDRRVQVSYGNVGSDSAIIMKAVFAVPEDGGGGCGGDCR